MPRRKKNVKAYGQGGRTRGRHKNYRSAETKVWNLVTNGTRLLPSDRTPS